MRKIVKNTILWGSVIICLVVIQSLLTVTSFKLNLAILPVFYLGFKKGDLAGFSSGIGAGLLEDILSGSIIGPSTLSKGMIGLFSHLLYEKFFVWTYLLGIVSVFLITIVDELIIYASMTIFSHQPLPFSSFATASLIKALVNSPFGGIIKKDEE
ncbi:MAG TPA: rod shape-determining protein MreD [Nitrospirae bacterium]|nr:rod shape-determining protein MreD [Nitrospirota bacterium]